MIKFIRKLMGHDDKFFALLEASATEAHASVQHLAKLLRSSRDPSAIDAMVQTRRNDKRITEEISTELCKTFVTPFEREDIEALSFSLYKIPKIIEKFGEKFLLCQSHLGAAEFDRQLALLSQAVDTVVEMVKNLRQHAKLEAMKTLNDRLHRLESEADRLMMDMTNELYSGRHEALRVIVILDLYGTLEKVVDRCRDAGNIVFQIVLKYS